MNPDPFMNYKMNGPFPNMTRKEVAFFKLIKKRAKAKKRKEPRAKGYRWWEEDIAVV